MRGDESGQQVRTKRCERGGRLKRDREIANGA